ncbi:MAG TPA: DUF4097 family beta strand repeat-containing protein [Vicinamibacterales bacterium]|jgi:DUF4097 and DUF4098 domain-containing protein YvlB
MHRSFIGVAAVVSMVALPLPLHAGVAGATDHSRWNARSWRASYEARMGPQQIEKTSKTFRIGANGTLDIGNVSGDMVITEAAGDTITIDATKKTRDSDARDEFARTTVTMVERAGRVEVRTTYTGRNNHASVDYRVTAPPGTAVIAHSVSGDIRISGIRGELRLESVSGDVSATGALGASLIKSVSGEVTLSGVSTQAELTASSISGNVTVTGAKVRSLDADTVSGELKLTDVSCDRATVKSISGDVDFSGTLARNGRYEMQSHSGEIRLMLAGDPGFELNAQTFSGNVRSDLPVTLRAGESIGGRHKGLRGIHGDGSAQLILHAFSGDITISRK